MGILRCVHLLVEGRPFYFMDVRMTFWLHLASMMTVGHPKVLPKVGGDWGQIGVGANFGTSS